MLKRCGAARFAYNWALSLINKNDEETKEFLQIGDSRKQFTALRADNAFKWLKEVSSEIPQQAIKDLGIGLDKFFKKLSEYPKFKKKGRSEYSFFI